MRLTVQTDYALRTLMCLAADPRLHTIDDIAQRYAISRNHLMKVVQKLAAEGLIASQRGRNGGIALAVPAEAMNLGQIVRAMEDTGSFVECYNSDTNSCVVSEACGLKHALRAAVEAFYQHLDRYSLAEMVGNRSAFAALLRPVENASARGSIPVAPSNR